MGGAAQQVSPILFGLVLHEFSGRPENLHSDGLVIHPNQKKPQFGLVVSPLFRRRRHGEGFIKSSPRSRG